ncbi:MAG: hypothetical protein J0H01_35975 [Rhizobiales bacterium]|nr:hypothetical protein [Hyphomicrobiales bacterium]
MRLTLPGMGVYLRGRLILAKAINCFLFTTCLDQIYREGRRKENAPSPCGYFWSDVRNRGALDLTAIGNRAFIWFMASLKPILAAGSAKPMVPPTP